jgi:uncharacterized protein DUF4129
VTGLLVNAAAQDSVRAWSTAAIHDTVAAIARQPAYAQSIRRSLLGRFFRFLLDRIRDLRDAWSGSPSARFAVIAGVALVVLVIVARIVVARRIEETEAKARTRRRRGDAGANAWARARELASAGDHDSACRAVYAAVLDDLARTGAVRVHASKTSGDYARELARRGAPSATAFRSFARQAERLVYGTRAITADDFDRLASVGERVVSAPMAA